MILRPIGDVLAMQQLHFAADVRRASEVEVPKTEVKPAELKLAQQLIEQQTAEKFDAEPYKDEVRGRIQAAIEKKVEGQEISVSETAPGERGQGHRSDGGAARQPREDRERPRPGQPRWDRARPPSASRNLRKPPRKAAKRNA